MKNSMFFILLGLFMATTFASSTRAQENESPAMFVVFEEFVAPSDMPKFWKVQNEALKKFDEHKFEMTFSAYRTNKNSYYWVIPIKSFADFDKLYEKMMSNHQILVEDGFDPVEKFRDLSTMNQFVVAWNKELSYNPSAEEDTEAHTFHKWNFIYLKAGHEKEAGEALKAYQKYYDSIDDSYTWNIYQVVFGNNTPCWISHVSAESEIILLQKEKALQEKHGKEFQKLWNAFRTHMRDSEEVSGWYLPNWSRE